MSNLAFKIANELLNRGFIESSISATCLKSVIASILPAEHPVIHYEVRTKWGSKIACHTVMKRTPLMTRNQKKVTCRRCLEMLQKGSHLTIDWEVS